jgi:hypothetical protein
LPTPSRSASFACHRGPHGFKYVCWLCPPMHVFKCGCWLCPLQVGLPALPATTVHTALSVCAGFACPKSVCRPCVPAYVFSQYAGPTRLRPVCQLCVPAHVFSQYAGPTRLRPVSCPSASFARLHTSLSVGAGFARPKSVLSVSSQSAELLLLCMLGYVYCPNFAVTTTMTIVPKFVSSYPWDINPSLQTSTLSFRHQRFGHPP